jgi:dihydrofolate reductase
MEISVIVAMANNGTIGKDNQLLWKLSDDLKLFKKRTSGHAVIMGRKTFESIGKPLPNRINIVISRSKTYHAEGCFIANNLEKALEIAKEQSNEEEVFVIGGEQIYKLAEKIANKLYLTKVNASLEGDAFFDMNSYLKWQIIAEQDYLKSEKNEFDFKVIEMVKV